jgi:predicted DNA-binding protein (MmcQ/YjbR family)
MAKYEWLDAHCLSKKGVVKEYKAEWDAVLYRIRDRLFVLRGEDKEGRPIVTVKLDPLHGELLRLRYDDIVPGYYMNKTHWNSLQLEGNVPDETVRDMLDQSYDLVLSSFPKKIQKEILEGNATATEP